MTQHASTNGRSRMSYTQSFALSILLVGIGLFAQAPRSTIGVVKAVCRPPVGPAAGIPAPNGPAVARAAAVLQTTSSATDDCLPQTWVLDYFNQASPLLNNSTWSEFNGIDQYQVQNNALKAVGNIAGMRLLWNGTYSITQEAYAVLTSFTPQSSKFSLLLKQQANTAAIFAEFVPAANRIVVETFDPSEGWATRGTIENVGFQPSQQFGARAYSDGYVEIYRDQQPIGLIDVTMWQYYPNTGRIGISVDNAQALSDRRRDAVAIFSGGMKRRLNLAAALLHDPEVILLDEPTVGVDPQSRNAIFENLEDLKRQGKALLYTTHYMEEAERLCDRIIIIDHGRVIADDTQQGIYRLLPAPNVLHVHLTPSTAPVSWLNELRSLEGIRAVDLDRNLLRIGVVSITRATPRVLDWLNDHSVAFEHVSSERANLETVFLTLTGRSLRDS